MIIKKRYLIEISSMVIFILLMSLLNYFFIFHETLNSFFLEKRNQKTLLNELSQKKSLAEKNKLAKKTLLEWKQKNPLLYKATQQSNDYLFLELTTLIQNTGFTISRIQPVQRQNHLHKNKDLFLQTSLNGNYFLLFYLICALNQNPWPTQLADITIKNKNQFQLRFALRDCNE